MLHQMPLPTLLDASFCFDAAFYVAAGMGDVITTKQRNIEELGFPQELHGSADGVFLDLPGPWHVSPHPLIIIMIIIIIMIALSNS